ncbi:pggt1b [Trichonephila clavipes]|nr:pggt1b [Trichonephila clavipes]
MSRKYCIYTDDEVLEALENYNDRCHPVVCNILDITSQLYSKGFDIAFCWLPSYVGIIGNDQADDATRSRMTYLLLAVPLSNMKRVIQYHILTTWAMGVKSVEAESPHVGVMRIFETEVLAHVSSMSFDCDLKLRSPSTFSSCYLEVPRQ